MPTEGKPGFRGEIGHCDLASICTEFILVIPGAFARLGRRAISLYQKALEKGCVRVAFLLLVVTGKDGTGKTSLVDSLLDLSFQENQLSTRGAAIRMTFRSTQGWKETSAIVDDLLAKGFVDGTRIATEKHSADNGTLPRNQSTDNDRSDFPSHLISMDAKRARVKGKYEEIMSQSSLGQDLASFCTEMTNEQACLIEQLRQDNELFRSYDNMVIAMIRDLGGQEVFLPTHAALMTTSMNFPNAAYIVVNKLTRDPNSSSSSVYRSTQGDSTLPMTAGRIKTDSDYTRHCLSVIKTAHCGAMTGHYLGETEGVASPPVFFVATHAGEPNAEQNIRDHEASLREIIISGGYEAHIVIPEAGSSRLLFPVDNKKSGTGNPDKMILLLKEKIEQMAKQQSLSQDPIPLSWFVLWKMVGRLSQMPQYKLAELRNITILAQHVCEIETAEEVDLALQCLSSYGLFLYYPEAPRLSQTVITDPQWFVGALSTFVTVIDPLQLPPYLRQSVTVLFNTGLMSWALAEYQMVKAGIRQESISSVLGAIELFDVAFPATGNDGLHPGSDLFVPGMMREDYKGSFLWQLDGSCDTRPPSLIFRPVGTDVVLETLYFRLVARCAAHISRSFVLKRDRALFHLPDDLDLELAFHNGRYIIATVKTVSSFSRFDAVIYEKHCSEIRQFLSFHLGDAKQTGMASLQLELCCQLPAWKYPDDCGTDIEDSQLVSLQGYNPDIPLLINGKGEHVCFRGQFEVINVWYGQATVRRKRKVCRSGKRLSFSVISSRILVEFNWVFLLADFDRTPTEDEMVRLAVNVGSKWKDLARRLKPAPLNGTRIEEIEYRHPRNISEQAQTMLETWLTEYGTKATIKRLYKALVKAKCRGVAERLFGRMK